MKKYKLLKMIIIAVCFSACEQNTTKSNTTVPPDSITLNDTLVDSVIKVDSVVARDDFDLEEGAISGKYLNNYSEVDEGFSGSIKIEYIGKKQFKFDISTYNENGNCTGALEGIATMENSHYAKYSSRECQSLIFEWSTTEEDITLMVSETECSTYHGFPCPFKGNYHKSQSN